MPGFSSDMSVIDKLSSHEIWISFLDEKMSTKNMDKGQIEDLSSFIHNREYLGVIDIIKNKENFQPPVKKMVSKQYSSKKRIVYSFSREENYVLKLLTYLLIRQYDYIFAKNLYSFRAKHGVKKAIDYLRRDRHLSNKYVYKVDIHDYFNSVDINILLPNLKEIMKDDIDAYSFIERLLTDSRAVTPNGDIIYEKKGIMAGVPLSSFLANVYLCQLDWYFYNNGNRYARYSDDMIVFANSDLERQNYVTYIHSYLADMHLSVNCEKESFSNPHEQWDFLGVSYHDGIFDISPISAKKLKKKMWRKSRALLRWKNRKHIENIYAAKADTLAYILEPIVKGLKADVADTEKAATGVYEWLKSVDVPNKLKDEGFSEADVEKLTELAFTTPSLDGLLAIAPTEATREAVATIYRESL